MKFLTITTLAFILNFFVIIHSWGNKSIISQDELFENKNSTKKHFEKGFKPHTMKSGLRVKNSQNNEVVIFSLTSKNNKLNLKYLKNENKIIFHLYVVQNNVTNSMEVQYSNISLDDGEFHYLVYRLGSSVFKLWVDCNLKQNINNEFKSPVNIDGVGFNDFGNNIILQHGDNNDIEYCQQINFINQPSLDYSFGDRSMCKRIFNVTSPQHRINNNYTEGTFYPLNLFQDLVKYDYLGVYYEINQYIMRDVSEYFEDGLDKDHSFEITYRMKSFPSWNHSYYFLLLTSGAESEISFSLDNKRNILKVHGSCNCNGNLVHFSTEYWADEIYNTDWHTIKYTLNNGIFTLWIDNELMEDFLGTRQVDFKFKDYDSQYMWFDTGLMIFEQPSTNLQKGPVLHIRKMKYYGNAITTNNTELPVVLKETEENGLLNSFFKVIGRSWFWK